MMNKSPKCTQYIWDQSKQGIQQPALDDNNLIIFFKYIVGS